MGHLGFDRRVYYSSIRGSRRHWRSPVRRKGGAAVGSSFAGSSTAIANPIGQLLSFLGATMVGNENNVGQDFLVAS